MDRSCNVLRSKRCHVSSHRHIVRVEEGFIAKQRVHTVRCLSVSSASCRFVNQLNAVASSPPVAPPGGLGEVTNQTGQISVTGPCGPMGVCIDSGMDNTTGATDVVQSPPMSASPVLTAVFAIFKVVIMVALGTLIGPVVSLYMVVRSYIHFLERIEMVRSCCLPYKLSGGENLCHGSLGLERGLLAFVGDIRD